MKRDPSLVSLSREHHQALVVAQSLRRADPAGAAAALDGFRAYWVTHGALHFEVEEQVLLPAFAEAADPHVAVVARVLCDHVELRSRGREALESPAPDLDRLHDLGRRLAEHVRLEEQELFPLIERTLSTERLSRLADELHQAESSDPARP